MKKLPHDGIYGQIRYARFRQRTDKQTLANAPWGQERLRKLKAKIAEQAIELKDLNKKLRERQKAVRAARNR